MFSPRFDNPSTFDLQPPTYNIRKRVLFVTYYFPPSGGPGVQRALKLVKYLPRFGWQPTVLTVRPGAAAFPDRDETLLGDVPESVRVERTAAWDPYALYARFLGKEKSDAVSVGFIGEEAPGWRERLSRWLRANVVLPDARVGWVPFAVARAGKLLQEDPFDALITTGPPHSTHLAGLLLARFTGVAWTADFRDPWTDISYYQHLPTTAPARRLDRAVERAVLRRAHRVTAVNPRLGQLLESKTTSDGGAPVHVIRNGFDPDDFSGQPHSDETKGEASAEEADEQQQEASPFVLAHVGNLTASQDPHALWEALQRLREQDTVPELRIRMVGNLDGAVRQSLRRRGLDDVLETVPYVPHAEAVGFMEKASLLVLCINRTEHAESITPGKTYEYVATGQPVLGLGPPEGDAAKVLRTSGAGRMFAHDDSEGVARFLEEHLRAWEAGAPRRGAAPEDADRFSRRRQAKQLSALMNRLSDS